MNTLEYFVGKVCTIFTSPINRDFKTESPGTYPKPIFQYFMGFVESVDQYGVLVRQVNSSQKSFFYHSAIVSISEEEVLNPQNHKDAEVIDSLKKQHLEQIAKFKEQKSKLKTVDPEELARKAQEMKDSFG